LGARNHVLDESSDHPTGKALLREGACVGHCKLYGLCGVDELCKRDELIEMPFGWLTRVSPRNIVLDGSPPRERGNFMLLRVWAHG